MESKLYEECHEGGGFMAQQAMLKQDETVRTQIPTMKPVREKIARQSSKIIRRVLRKEAIGHRQQQEP